MTSERLIGVISDTHGLLRDQAYQAMMGSDHIIHAGDIGPREILDKLAEIAPVTAIRGNTDRGDWTESLPEDAVAEIGEVQVYVIHDLYAMNLDPAKAGFLMVVSGHSHRPALEEKDGVLFLNPGSAGPRRFDLPVSVAHVTVTGKKLEVKFITLNV